MANRFVKGAGLRGAEASKALHFRTVPFLYVPDYSPLSKPASDVLLWDPTYMRRTNP